MPKFRKKPVVIEARQYRGCSGVAEISYLSDFETWLREKDPQGNCQYLGEKLVILTLEGVLTADVNDWIICGVKGELYPCKPDIFAAIYEPVEEEQPEKD